MFNVIANKIKREEVIPDPALAAQILYPEVFLKPRDEYMQRILQDIAESEATDIFKTDQEHGLEEIPRDVLAYMGNIHVDPVSHMWNEQNGATSQLEDQEGGRNVLGLNQVKQKKEMKDERLNLAKMMYVYRTENTEKADDQI